MNLWRIEDDKGVIHSQDDDGAEEAMRSLYQEMIDEKDEWEGDLALVQVHRVWR